MAARSRGCILGLGVLFRCSCASLGAAYTAADGQGPATGAVEGRHAEWSLGPDRGSVAACRS